MPVDGIAVIDLVYEAVKESAGVRPRRSTHAVLELIVDKVGCVTDIDTVADLQAVARRLLGSLFSVLDDDAAGQARARVAGGLGFVVVWITVHDQAAPQHIGLSAAYGHAAGLEAETGGAIGISLQAGQVTGMVFVLIVRPVCFAVGVEMAARTQAIATGAIAFVVNVKAVLAIGLEALDLTGDSHFVAHWGELNLTRHGVALRGHQLGRGRRPGGWGGAGRHEERGCNRCKKSNHVGSPG